MPSDGFKFIWDRDLFVHSFTGQTLKYKLNVRRSVRDGCISGHSSSSTPTMIRKAPGRASIRAGL